MREKGGNSQPYQTCEKLILQEEKYYFNPTKDDYFKRNLVMGKVIKRKTQIVDMICMFFSRTTKRKFGL